MIYNILRQVLVVEDQIKEQQINLDSKAKRMTGKPDELVQKASSIESDHSIEEETN
ncbi:hypothetical protein [Pedobacter sp. WC2423]|uniref:hypothetical protein n=1 Tax=Pedobacter sp. WC2423 TaxID=3234142 RepID=UPI003466251A